MIKDSLVLFLEPLTKLGRLEKGKVEPIYKSHA